MVRLDYGICGIRVRIRLRRMNHHVLFFGMPREALRIGAAVEAKNIEGIISFMKKWE